MIQKRNAYRVQDENLKKIGRLIVLGIDGIIVLKWILEG